MNFNSGYSTKTGEARRAIRHGLKSVVASIGWSASSHRAAYPQLRSVCAARTGNPDQALPYWGPALRATRYNAPLSSGTACVGCARR